jgi:hypothetical protein
VTNRAKNRRNRRAFEKTTSAVAEDEQVCGTLDVEGKPLYFTMPSSATDAEVRAQAFELRNGRSLSGVEQSLIRIVERDLPDVGS